MFIMLGVCLVVVVVLGIDYENFLKENKPPERYDHQLGPSFKQKESYFGWIDGRSQQVEVSVQKCLKCNRTFHQNDWLSGCTVKGKVYPLTEEWDD